ncbi:MAG TPA: SDR family NAD(P)-dependent oxidoreductase, partial [Labilithrix sp.]|nr:SDR family NAD(P)-dependent oxidoreductase [Labilithrix sp.]
MFGRPIYDIDRKVILITGGAQGIGFAVAQQLHARGAQVALVDVNADALAEAKASFDSERVLTCTGDVRDRERMGAIVDQVVAHFGRLDVVVA